LRTSEKIAIAELRLRSNISLKSCGFSIAEVLPSSCALRLRAKKKWRVPTCANYISAGMPDCLTSGQSGTGMKKTNDARTVPVSETQSGIFLVRYRSEVMNAGMPIPALVFSMLMPN
jgi:hypothetical protein